MKNKYSSYKEILQQLQDEDSLRTLKPLGPREEAYINFNGKKLLNLNSNDYLGLATDKPLITEFYNNINPENVNEFYGPGSSSSRLLTGNSNLYMSLEQSIAESYNSTSALVFNSGYHANTGVIPALAGQGDLILSDKLNHASIIDGIKLSGATFERYKHLDYDQLEEFLKKKRRLYNKTFIISESLFSMDGDIADIKILSQIKNKYDAILYIDEAHAVGTRGNTGLGICEEQDAIEHADIIMGTFGKALASMGAFVVSDETIKNIIVNRCRSLIYSTALPPVILNWNSFIWNKNKVLNNRRKHLKTLTKNICDEFNKYGYTVSSLSNIIPFIVGKNEACIELSSILHNNGFLVFPIRYPTVPKNTARLRISLSSTMKQEDICRLPQTIKSSGK